MMKRLIENIKTMVKRIGENITAESISDIVKLLERNNSAELLDLGCGDGNLTLKAASAIGTVKIYGIDVIGQTVERAREKGINVLSGDLKTPDDRKYEFKFYGNSRCFK